MMYLRTKVVSVNMVLVDHLLCITLHPWSLEYVIEPYVSTPSPLERYDTPIRTSYSTSKTKSFFSRHDL